MSNRQLYTDFTFTSGVSNAQPMAGYTLVGFITPAGFTGTSVTLQASPTSNGTFLDVYDATNTLISYTVDGTNARHYDFSNDFPFSADFVKLKSTGGVGTIKGILRLV